MEKRESEVSVTYTVGTDDITTQKPTYQRRRHFKLIWCFAGIIGLVALGSVVGIFFAIKARSSEGDKDFETQSTNNNRRSAQSDPIEPEYHHKSLWRPTVNTTWQIVLINPIKIAPNATRTVPDVDVFDIDLFDTNKQTIQKLHSLGKKVVCYFSAGTYEDWRPDAKRFQKKDLGKALGDWPGESWLQISSSNVRSIMRDRIKLASQKGCDAIDPDNIDGYSNDNGLRLSKRNSISYIWFLSKIAASYKMSCGLKNGGDLISSVIGATQFAINEQCEEYDECSTWRPFIKKNKPVFHIEYPKTTNKSATSICNSVKGMGLSTVLKDMDLNGWAEYCDGTVVDTPVVSYSS